MKWLRLRSRGFAGVALLAMAVQIFCTFGHVHLTDRASLPAAGKFVAFAKTQSAKVVVSGVAAIDAVSPLPSGDSDPLCPLCLVGNLVASAVVSYAPPLVLPIVHTRLDPPRLDVITAPFEIQLSFWSRGPPTS